MIAQQNDMQFLGGLDDFVLFTVLPRCRIERFSERQPLAIRSPCGYIRWAGGSDSRRWNLRSPWLSVAGKAEIRIWRMAQTRNLSVRLCHWTGPVGVAQFPGFGLGN